MLVVAGSGAAWGCMGLYGAIWGCMALHGALWVCMELHRTPHGAAPGAALVLALLCSVPVVRRSRATAQPQHFGKGWHSFPTGISRIPLYDCFEPCLENLTELSTAPGMLQAPNTPVSSTDALRASPIHLSHHNSGCCSTRRAHLCGSQQHRRAVCALQDSSCSPCQGQALTQPFWRWQYFTTRPPFRTGIFLFLAFPWLLCIHISINKSFLFFFYTKKNPQIYLVFTVFSSLDSGPHAGSDPVLTAVMGTQQIPVDVN